jgi:hypothetical protein
LFQQLAIRKYYLESGWEWQCGTRPPRSETSRWKLLRPRRCDQVDPNSCWFL